MYIRKKRDRGRIYYSLVERVRRDDGRWTIRTLQSFGTVEPIVYEPHLLVGDALELLPTLPAESVDMVLTDPPYGVGKKNLKDKYIFPDSFGRRFGSWDIINDDKAYLEWTFRWVDEVMRVMRPGAVMVCFYPYRRINFLLAYLQERHSAVFINHFFWLRSNSSPTFSYETGRLTDAVDMALIIRKAGRKNFFNKSLCKSWPNHFDCAVPSAPEKRRFAEGDEWSGYRIHPNQRPLALIDRLLMPFSQPGDVVLDPFAGSGTTLEACSKLFRKSVGIELAKDDPGEGFSDMAQRRIDAMMAETRLPTIPASEWIPNWQG